MLKIGFALFFKVGGTWAKCHRSFPYWGFFIYVILCSSKKSGFWNVRLFIFTGELKTLALLDRERVPVYNLIARATDGGGRFCQSDIHLILEDVNDNPPVFSSEHYNACVYENTATKALLTRVQAVDPDVGKSVALMRCLLVHALDISSVVISPLVLPAHLGSLPWEHMC